MKAASIFWGDPHSAFALKNALEGNIKIKYLVSVFSKYADSVSGYYPNIKLMRLVSEATDIPLMYKTKSDSSVFDLIEEQLKGIRKEIDVVVIGETDLNMHRKYEQAFRLLGLRTVNPLMGIDRETFYEKLLHSGYSIFVTGSETGLSEWVGNSINEDNLNDFLHVTQNIQHRFPPNIETFVIDCPAYKRRIEILDGKKTQEGDRTFFIIKNAILIEKKTQHSGGWI